MEGKSLSMEEEVGVAGRGRNGPLLGTFFWVSAVNNSGPFPHHLRAGGPVSLTPSCKEVPTDRPSHAPPASPASPSFASPHARSLSQPFLPTQCRKQGCLPAPASLSLWMFWGCSMLFRVEQSKMGGPRMEVQMCERLGLIQLY